MKTKSLLIKRITLVVIATALALVLSEVLLRQIAPIYPTGGMPQAYKYDPELGYRLRPGVHLFRTTDFQQEVRVNELGTANFQDNFEGYDSLVFALGDSFTHGLGVPADMSYPFQLELILNEDEQGLYKRHFGVVNLGTAGFGGEQSLEALNRWSSLLRPPAVILYLGCDNDYEDDQALKKGHRHDLPVTDSPYWGRMVPLVQWFNDLQIRLRIKTMSEQMKHARAQTASVLQTNPAQAQTESTETLASVAELEAPVLERLAAYAQAHNSLLIVSWSGEGPSYQWLKSWAAGKRVAFADWAPKVQAVQDAIPALPRENQHSDRHYRGWVNHLIAEEFARRIKAHQ
jgi:hypothetical protein